MKIFRLNNTYSVVCETHNTSYGFKHTATLMKNGSEIDDAKSCYYNERIWESYRYQTVLYLLLDKTTMLTDKEKRRFRNKVK